MITRSELFFILLLSFAVGAACGGTDGLSATGTGGGGMTTGAGGGGMTSTDGGMTTGAGGGGAVSAEGDGMPKDAVSFFDAAGCPDGWLPYGFANGRAIVPTSVGAENRTIGGTVITTDAARPHRHTLASSVTIPGVGFALVDGCCNNSPANKGTFNVAATTSSVETGVPYAFLMVCKKAEEPEPAAAAPPTGMFSYFDLNSCPTGWGNTTDEADGRFVVGLPEGGENGAVFGGAPVADGSLPSHSHSASGSISTSSTGITGVSSGGGGYAKNGSYSFNTTTSTVAEDFPYIQLLRCKKL
jgi:hypothetical protein